jgi:hypothetical protein
MLLFYNFKPSQAQHNLKYKKKDLKYIFVMFKCL